MLVTCVVVIPSVSIDQSMLQELCGSVEVHLDTFRQYSQFYAAQHELDLLFGKWYM